MSTQLPEIILNNPKFDGLKIERSTIVEHGSSSVLTNEEDEIKKRTVVLSDLSTLNCLPSILNFPEPAQRGNGSWRKGSFLGTDSDLLEIDRIARMQDLHVLDMIRREVDLESLRQNQLNPKMGLPPDKFRKIKLNTDFEREREASQEKLKCVIADHQAFLEALYADHNREFDRATRLRRKEAKRWLRTKVKYAQTTSEAESLSCGIEMMQHVMKTTYNIIQERYMESVVRPAHRSARVFLRERAMEDHANLHLVFRSRLLKHGITIHEVVFPRFRDTIDQLQMDINVTPSLIDKQLVVVAYDPDSEGGTNQKWMLHVPMPTSIMLYLSLDQKTDRFSANGFSVYKTNLQCAQKNYNEICSTLEIFLRHLLLVRDKRDRRKLVLRYDPTMEQSSSTTFADSERKNTSTRRKKKKKWTSITMTSELAGGAAGAAGDIRFRRRQGELHRESIFLYRQYEQDNPGTFYCHDNPEKDRFRAKYLYTQDINDIFMDRANELFSIFCEYAVRDKTLGQTGKAGVMLSSEGFATMLLESGLLGFKYDSEEEGEQEEEEEETLRRAVDVVKNMFCSSVLSNSNNTTAPQAYFGDFLEALVRFVKFSQEDKEEDVSQAHFTTARLTSHIQMAVEVLITSTEVETWPALHRRQWADHILFLRATGNQNVAWGTVPPETRQ